MKAIALRADNKKLEIIDVSEPEISAPDEVKLHVLQVGICGTDRDEATGGRGNPPAGQSQLIIGHEMIGKVVEVGSDVRSVKTGDFAVFTVRRGCGHCSACRMSRSDMCYSGDYKERGIKGINGYQAEFVVDKELYLVRVPQEIASIGVLTEPMSVVEKAIDEVIRVQMERLPDAADPGRWIANKTCLVAGLGPIGLLAAMALRLRGANVIGLDVQDKDSARPTLLRHMEGRYVDGREVFPDKLEDHFGHIDVIFEATGIAALEFELIEALGSNGVYVLTGIPCGHRPVKIDGPELMQHIVLKNLVVVGSVNASEAHFQRAVEDLEKGASQWPDVLSSMITHRVPYQQMEKVLSNHAPDEIKAIIQWSTF